MNELNKFWDSFIEKEKKEKYFIDLNNFICNEYKNCTIYPPQNMIFNAFRFSAPDTTKVVIVGQDCYHEENQANGLAFSVNENVRIPPSLLNIFKELKSDVGIEIPTSGDLTRWALQGIFLINTIMTVREHQANSHAGMGWEIFTDKVIKELNNDNSPKVFILWGNSARSKKYLITNKNHIILEASHPSPLSAYRGFFGCKHFSKTNDFLIRNNLKPIDW